MPDRSNEDDERGAKGSYSREFVAAFRPLADEAQTAGANAQALKARVPALLALAASADEKYAAGQLALNIGSKAQDVVLQRRGVELMLASGKVAAEQLGPVSLAAGELAYNAKDYAAARAHFELAVANGSTVADMPSIIANTYFGENNVAAGLDVLDKAIAAKVAAGQTIPESWLQSGLAKAYTARLVPQAVKFGALYAQHYPSVDSWGDAIAIQRNLFDYGDNEMLDLMRLAQRTGSLRREADYLDYIAAADPRRLPGEVSQLIAAGIAAGKINADNAVVANARSIAGGRVAADRADLPSLEKGARASSATAIVAAAAGDAFLSHGEAATAEALYAIALTKPGVDTAKVQTRLGIAQFDQGKFVEAQTTFAKVQGPRQPIAELWGVLAEQKMR